MTTYIREETAKLRKCLVVSDTRCIGSDCMRWKVKQEQKESSMDLGVSLGLVVRVYQVMPVQGMGGCRGRIWPEDNVEEKSTQHPLPL